MLHSLYDFAAPAGFVGILFRDGSALEKRGLLRYNICTENPSDGEQVLGKVRLGVYEHLGC